jgi:hypothetical protein
MENHQRFSAFGFFLARFSHGGRAGKANEKDFFMFGENGHWRFICLFACVCFDAWRGVVLAVCQLHLNSNHLV